MAHDVDNPVLTVRSERNPRNNGCGHIVSGTESFRGFKGAGTLPIKSANPTDRIVILDGQVVAAN